MTSFADSRTLTIAVRNAATMAPKFNSSLFSSPYQLSVIEGQIGINLVTFSASKVQYDVCYYIVGKYWTVDLSFIK